MVTPEHHRLEGLLLEMRTERQHSALVIDEHGTVVRLVTLEDVIEELSMYACAIDSLRFHASVVTT